METPALEQGIPAMGDEELIFRSEEERHAYAMGLAMEYVSRLDPLTVGKCGKERLLKDFQQQILLTAPKVMKEPGP